MKIEVWNGHAIRFVEKDRLWWTIAKDVCDALGLTNIVMALQGIPDPYISKVYIGVITGKKRDGSPAEQKIKMLCLNELGIYRLIMRSNKPEAEAFQDWVFNLLKSLREALGYEQYRIMAFTDSVKNHHLNMDLIKEALNPQDKVPYIKAHSVTNKCMATIVGEPKAISKDELKEKYPEMIPLRDEVLSSTTELMTLNERLNLGLSVSETIYKKYCEATA